MIYAMRSAKEKQYILRVALDDYRPLSCSSAFAELLDHRSPRSCVSSLQRSSPFLGYTLRQVARMNDNPLAAQQIKVLNIQNKPVAMLAGLNAGDQNDLVMHIEPLADNSAMTASSSVSEIVIDRLTSHISLSEMGVSLLGLRDNQLNSFLDQVLIEDRQWIEQCLKSRSLGPKTICFQITNRQGEIIDARLRYRQRSSDTDSTLEGTLALTKGERLRPFALMSTGSIPNVDCLADEVVFLPRTFRLEKWLPALQDVLSSCWQSRAVLIDVLAGPNLCSLCEMETEPAAVTITTRDNDFAGTALSDVFSADPAQFNPGPLRLGRIISRVHEQGIHVGVCITRQGALQIKLMVQDV